MYRKLMLAFVMSSRLAVAAPPAFISPFDYGAVCDGITDDTLALQATIASADAPPFPKIQLPASTCRFTSTLTFGGNTTRYSQISVVGQSEYLSTLMYDGPPADAILISHMSTFTWSAFTVRDANESGRGQAASVGVELSGPFNSGGTMDTTITFDHISFYGFNIGMLVGNGDAGSEVDCHQCTFQRNTIGWTANGYNSLNFWFSAVHLAANDTGMKFGGPWVTEGARIYGGDSYGEQIDFDASNSFDTLLIDSFRAQVSSGSKFITDSRYDTQGGGYPLVNITNSTILGDVTQAVVDVASNFSIHNSTINGQICALRNGGLVSITDSLISPNGTDYPVIYQGVNNAASSWACYYQNNEMPSGRWANANGVMSYNACTSPSGLAPLASKVPGKVGK